MLAVETVPTEGAAVDAVAVKDGDETIVWVFNRTPTPRKVSIEGIGKEKHLRVARVGGVSARESRDQQSEGAKAIDLAPFEVCRVASWK